MDEAPIRPTPRMGKVRSPTKKKEPKKVQIDWKEYFIEFCKVHGEPVEYNGVLLFRDGWRYAMEYAGPEHKPPSDHKLLDKLIVTYWSLRLRSCKERLNKTWVERKRIERLQDEHSLPLKQVTIVGMGQDRRRVSSNLDTRQLDDRIRWLQADIEECEQMLKEVNDFYTTGKPANNSENGNGKATPTS